MSSGPDTSQSGSSGPGRALVAGTLAVLIAIATALVPLFVR
jgi:hypothetical protein